mmetsp:Transcript_63154/g.150577  ORF Transcript_63154/g.150577 Transcript_63154/m.150577 type:complete len:255 (+) Transcript_63154:109-873(+)|eukprot:CAMPEP_0178422520 /NCGR_PEP_ID=MMETSP0689_2-20121128/27217_1 /TAXON_ID=160604 /ORGANISM="Amphidinium massartii, Strain CS-259" /LENGTH=254 /DNA_ID=CAMNT_0020044089 /DNA_START=108 /DNA_END=872 /DNA_ORIENTATION=-
MGATNLTHAIVALLTFVAIATSTADKAVVSDAELMASTAATSSSTVTSAHVDDLAIDDVSSSSTPATSLMRAEARPTRRLSQSAPPQEPTSQPSSPIMRQEKVVRSGWDIPTPVQPASPPGITAEVEAWVGQYVPSQWQVVTDSAASQCKQDGSSDACKMSAPAEPHAKDAGRSVQKETPSAVVKAAPAQHQEVLLEVNATQQAQSKAGPIARAAYDANGEEADEGGSLNMLICFGFGAALYKASSRRIVVQGA